MQPADKPMRYDASGPLNRTWNWRILVQGAMCPGLIVIVGIRVKDAAQMQLTEHHKVVNALAAGQSAFRQNSQANRAKSACREYPSLSNDA
jgi:hypothetical protein